MFKNISLNIRKSFTYNCLIIYILIDLLVLVYDLLNKIKFKLNDKKYKQLTQFSFSFKLSLDLSEQTEEGEFKLLLIISWAVKDIPNCK